MATFSGRRLSLVLCFVNPMLPVSQIIFVQCFGNPMLPVSLDKTQDEDNPESLATFRPLFWITKHSDWRLSSSWQHWVHWNTGRDNPVTLDYLRPVFCDPNVASVSGLSSSCVLCSQCCQWRRLSSSCVLWSQCCQCLWRLSSSCVLCSQCCQCLWRLSSSCVLWSQCWQDSIRSCRDTGNIGFTTQDENNPVTLAHWIIIFAGNIVFCESQCCQWHWQL